MQLAWITFVAAVSLWAQDAPPVASTPPTPQAPPVLTNSGKAMTVPFQCTAEDIHAAGLDCSEDDPCPVYLELTALESTGIRLFTAGNIHTSAATLYSVLLGSEDNGHTWREFYERMRGTALDRFQFSGADAGWLSGHSIYPLPQDPFLLTTTDGGKTWRQHPVFNESGFGVIQQFWFDDVKTGALTIDRGAGSDGDRYERYESQDGGDSWTIKESSVRSLRLRRVPAANADWRIRADGTSKSFHLEHREGSKWVTLSAFNVNLGACKPPE